MVIDHLLLLLLSLFLVLSDGSETIRLVCHDATDYHSLLYETCRREPVCSHLYHLKLVALDSTNQTRLGTREFRKFVTQIKRLTLFQSENTTTTNVAAPRSAPRVTLTFDSAAPVNCTHGQGGIKTSATSPPTPSNQLFTMTALMAMQNYKTFASDESLYTGANEQLVLNAEGELVAVCLRGKVCAADVDPNFPTILLVLVVFLLAAIALWIPSQFLTLHTITQRLYAIAVGNNNLK